MVWACGLPTYLKGALDRLSLSGTLIVDNEGRQFKLRPRPCSFCSFSFFPFSARRGRKRRRTVSHLRSPDALQRRVQTVSIGSC